jgi:hypothetical protein
VKRLRPIVFNALTVLSLLFCLATAGLWVRSYRLGESIGWRRGNTLYYAVNGRGGMGLATTNVGEGIYSPGWNYNAWSRPSYGRGGWPQSSFWNRHGFVFTKAELFTGILVPAWLLVSIFLSLPSVRFIVFCVRRRRIQRGGCATCGYDLRATPDRCPECGTISTKAKA